MWTKNQLDDVEERLMLEFVYLLSHVISVLGHLFQDLFSSPLICS